MDASSGVHRETETLLLASCKSAATLWLQGSSVMAELFSSGEADKDTRRRAVPSLRTELSGQGQVEGIQEFMVKCDGFDGRVRGLKFHGLMLRWTMSMM